MCIRDRLYPLFVVRLVRTFSAFVITFSIHLLKAPLMKINTQESFVFCGKDILNGIFFLFIFHLFLFHVMPVSNRQAPYPLSIKNL